MGDNSLIPGPEEIRTQLTRILSSQTFHHKEKLSRFLRYVVEATLAGESDKIKQSSIGIEALGYPLETDSDNVVRSHARRLRKALQDYYDGPGGKDSILIELPKGSYVPRFCSNVRKETDGVVQPPAARWQWHRRLAVAVVVIAAGALFALRWQPSTSPGQPRLIRLTMTDSDTHSPSLSSDGRFLAYASDHAEGGSDIWFRTFPAWKDEIRLTRHPADDYDPDISPGGRWVVFRSMREGGGLYLVDAEGKQERRLGDGFTPRFSPDGHRIVYTSIVESGNSQVFVQPVQGGTPRMISKGFSDARRPVWSTDGKRVIVSAKSAGPGTRDYDWWILPVDSDETPIQTGAIRPIADISKWKPHDIYPSDWSGNHLIAAANGIVELSLGTDGRVQDEVRNLHSNPDAANPRYASLARDKILFAVRQDQIQILGTGLQNRFAKAIDVRQSWTSDASLGWLHEYVLSLSADGETLAFRSIRGGHWNIWARNIRQGTERMVTAGADLKKRPVLNPNGTRVAFHSGSDPASSIRAADVATGNIITLCENCGELRDWSADEKRLLTVEGNNLLEVDLQAKTRRTIVGGEQYEPLEAYSPDGRWIALVTGARGKHMLQGVLLPAYGGFSPSDWINVTEELYNLALRWSLDGNLIYYLSRRDDFRCLWAQRVEAKAKRPIGKPFPVIHFHDRDQIRNHGWAAIGGDWLAVIASRRTSTLFLLRRAGI